jgi:hypothetical protein
MGGSTIVAHGAHRIASLLKASPEGEGVHPSPNATLRNPLNAMNPNPMNPMNLLKTMNHA